MLSNLHDQLYFIIQKIRARLQMQTGARSFFLFKEFLIDRLERALIAVIIHTDDDIEL